VPYPNPYSGNGYISFYYVLSTGGIDSVVIKVYTTCMRLVKEFDNCPENCGQNIVSWDSRDHFGSSLANGLYYFTIEAKREHESIRKIGKLSVLR
jgi:flagellar hook assembly protein FlgD